MTEIIFNEAGINQLLTNPEGRIGTYLYKRGRRIEVRARKNVDNPGRGRQGKKPKLRTGDLRDHMFTTRPAMDSGSLAVVVGSDARHNGVDYPLLLEKGGSVRFRIRRGPSRGKFTTRRYRYPWLRPAFDDEFRGG